MDDAEIGRRYDARYHELERTRRERYDRGGMMALQGGDEYYPKPWAELDPVKDALYIDMARRVHAPK